MDLDLLLHPFPITLRDEQRDQTTTRMVAAALTLIRTGGEAAVTMRAVAELAGVTERTAYRHFESRENLLVVVWWRVQELIGPNPLPRTADALIEKPRDLFPRLDQQRDLVRAFLHSEAMRADPKPDRDRQQAMVACVGEELEYLDQNSLRRRAAIAEVLASPYAWQYMRRAWGFTGERAGQAAAEALEILLNRGLAY